MAKPNYAFEKRQREQAKKQKKADKAQRKADGTSSGASEDGSAHESAERTLADPAPVAESPAAASSA